MKWFLYAMKKYAVFGGRARRKEYWYFVLFYALITIALDIVDMATGTFNRRSHRGLLSWIGFAVFLIPSLAVSVRRLHDIGRSGFWLGLPVIPAFIGLQISPLVGGISLLVVLVALAILMMRDSQPGLNAYGPSPKANDVTAADVKV